jgi:anti-anti-sigma factor
MAGRNREVFLNAPGLDADNTGEDGKPWKLRRSSMGIQNWSEDIILVDLPSEPEMGEELKTITEMVRDRGDCEVVVDFSRVDIITSSSLSKLLRLRKLVGDCGHRLVFCSVAPATKGIFTVTGLDGVFEIVDDKFIALASLQMVG